ncbi:hypothetical protein FQN60_006421 [Etheostoma spectabile]|uniref:Uncharacterized protein n=1 Tax=Etheostoma spectabile TaxID=54343 RepID=A0A5J5CQU5_9PERO|nr:hypothetical protein FQN60_006421 [Etheostoma spectabile]
MSTDAERPFMAKLHLPS